LRPGRPPPTGGRVAVLLVKELLGHNTRGESALRIEKKPSSHCIFQPRLVRPSWLFVCSSPLGKVSKSSLYNAADAYSAFRAITISSPLELP
jgi:hypothetical protein